MKIAARPFPPHPRGHSHNDEMQSEPLQHALRDGFTSIEVDLHRVGNRLLVGHDREDAIQQERTVEETYLQPLWERVQQYGACYPDGTPLTLMLDLKGKTQETLELLMPLLERYDAMLTHVSAPSCVEEGPLRVVITGNSPAPESLAEPRNFFVDGSLAQTLLHPEKADPDRTPTVSGNYRAYFRWNGQGCMPDAEQKRLREMLDTVHQHGMELRLWNAPDQPQAWQTFTDLGLDRINTDRLDDYAAWQAERP